MKWLWIAVLGGAFGAVGAGAAPRVTPVAAGRRSEVQPAACTLKGTQVLAYEVIETAHQRRVWVQHKTRRGFWRGPHRLPRPRRDFTHRHPSLLSRPDGKALLYVQVGDIRRRQASIRLFQSGRTPKSWKDRGLLKLGLPGRLAVTRPFVSPGNAGEVLLTVTVAFSRKVGGCYLARSKDGQTFGTARRLGVGDQCRVVALGPRKLLWTYQHRPRRRLPLRGWYRLSSDDGKTWSVARRVSQMRQTSEVFPLVMGADVAWLIYRVTFRTGSVLRRSVLRPGNPLKETGITRRRSLRDMTPFGLRDGRLVRLYYGRESARLNFDVVELLLKP